MKIVVNENAIAFITVRNNPHIEKNWIYQSQIRKATRIVFSKCDMLDEAVLIRQIEKFKAAFPEKEVIREQQFSIDVLYPDNAVELEKTPAGEFSILEFAKKEDYKETTILLGTEYFIDMKRLSAFFEKYPSVVRAKGYLQTENDWIFLNYALSGIVSEKCAVRKRNKLVIIAKEVFNPDDVGFVKLKNESCT
jgi:G3E family GTPase